MRSLCELFEEQLIESTQKFEIIVCTYVSWKAWDADLYEKGSIKAVGKISYAEDDFAIGTAWKLDYRQGRHEFATPRELCAFLNAGTVVQNSLN